MKTMTQARRASAALAEAAGGGLLAGVLTPAVFGCPYGHTARIITSPLPFGRCGGCGEPLAILDTGQTDHATIRRAG
ncbi:MAG: hypothetical protein ACFCUT_08665 [Kiloniellaceae bacterium]